MTNDRIPMTNALLGSGSLVISAAIPHSTLPIPH